MKTLFVISLCLVQLSMSLKAQTDSVEKIRTRKASYGVGYSHTRFQDNHTSPYKYKCDNIPFHFRYTIENPKNVFEYNFNGIIGFNNHIENPEISLSHPEKSSKDLPDIDEYELTSPILFQQYASVRYYARIYQFSSRRINIYAGGEFREQFLSSMSVGPTFTSVDLGLNISMLLTHDFKEDHSIRLYYSSPLVGMRVYLPNANIVDAVKNGPDGSLSSANITQIIPWKHQRTNYSIEYVRNLSSEWSVGCEFCIFKYTFEDEELVKFYDNSLTIKLTKTL